MRLSTPLDTDTLAPTAVRKRRIEMRQLQRFESEDDLKASNSKRVRYDDSLSSSSSTSGDEESSSSAGNVSIRGYKKHARYVPEVPMTKAELSAWRKEARRVRNRESAAASRQKTRSRIEELEGQVDKLQEKYLQALQRIADLENGVRGRSTPATLYQDMMLHMGHTSSCTPAADVFVQPELSVTVSPPQSPRSEPLFISEDLNQSQHMDMFSRSTDV
ncbi:hypothetical protein FisN_23Lh023 [Fistulifera solaris]|uniref:BZIP domain-containing protein n=1 Tax=Fistulifera solaris TaxID=1519565 RepID=A0A1Z5KKP5_FISSO|nr:hypothetical protein FisN_23Lh023 [Fistulifera solaris]|eukprot:GAX26498.1 hypothetical protein FisN_23Lh023 [Fistulifera solaris]